VNLLNFKCHGKLNIDALVLYKSHCQLLSEYWAHCMNGPLHRISIIWLGWIPWILKILEISNFWNFFDIDSLSRLKFSRWILKAVQFLIFWPKLIFIGEITTIFIRVNTWIFVEYPPRSNYQNYIHRVNTGIFQILEKF